MKRTRRSKTVSAVPRRVLLANADQFHPLALGVIDYAAEAGWVPTFAQRPHLDPAKQVALTEAHAVIVSEVLPRSEANWRDVRVPIVCTEYPPDPAVRAGYVLRDYCVSGRLAAEHFLAGGFGHLTYCYLGKSWALDEQFKGFAQAARDGGATLHALDWTAREPGYEWDFDSIRRWLAKRIGEMPKPLGLFVDSDWTGAEAVTALRRAGILIPDQVAIVSCYNFEAICKGCVVPLSSVDINWHAQGYRAAEVLDAMMNGAAPPRKPVMIPPIGVVVRTSSDVMAVPHAGLAKAMHMIENDFRDPELTVRSMARRIELSTVALDLAFKKHLGQMPSDRLREKRLREAMKLLATTDLMVKDIAAACGFGTVEQFIRNVTAATGLSPRAWRKQQKA